MFRILCVLLCLTSGMSAAETRLEYLTSPEVEAALQNGKTTVLIPTGGTEQNGAHITLGKHNLRIANLSVEIAEALGDTLVAPVLGYVPEGRINPPEGHMRFPGTISLPEPLFAEVVLYAARSLKQAGFHHIVLLGDSGGNQRALHQVAQTLNAEFGGGVVLYADAYYGSNAVFVTALQDMGVPGVTGGHAGVADTAMTLATAPDAIRKGARLDHPGVDGDPAAATRALGEIGVRLFVDRTVAQIRAFRGE